MTDKQTPPDWVLIKAWKRCKCYEDYSLKTLQISYGSNPVFAALCDMIFKHEQPPVVRKTLCAEKAASEWDNSLLLPPIDVAVRAIELWEDGFGK